MLPLIDEDTRECLAILVARRIRATDVIDLSTDVMQGRGVPEHICADDGPAMVVTSLRRWLARVGAKTLSITSGSPWETGYCETFNGRLRDERLNGEIFYTLREPQVLVERWRVYDNTRCPHGSLKYRSPAPETAFSRSLTLEVPQAA